MPKNDIEAFEYVIADEDTALEIDYLTYAMFARKKREWVDHFKKQNGDQLPTQEQIDGWISQLSPYDFTQMRTEAADFFDWSSKAYLEDYVEDQKREAVDQSILREVKAYTSPWKHLGIALLMAIVAPIVLGGLIFFWSIFDKSFPIHVSVGSAPVSSQQAQ